MTPQDLLFIQAKVSNSFLRAFYPNDYRAMQRQMDKTNKSVNKETVNIKKTDRLTSDLNTKLSRVLGLLEREISDLAESVDNINLNSAEAPMNINIDVLGGAMDDAGGWMLGLLGLLRSIKKRAREREKVREEEEKKAKEEADKKAKEEAEADRKSKETSSENTKANEGEVKPPPETRAASDIKPSPTEVGGGRSLVEQGAAAATAGSGDASFSPAPASSSTSEAASTAAASGSSPRDGTAAAIAKAGGKGAATVAVAVSSSSSSAAAAALSPPPLSLQGSTLSSFDLGVVLGESLSLLFVISIHLFKLSFFLSSPHSKKKAEKKKRREKKKKNRHGLVRKSTARPAPCLGPRLRGQVAQQGPPAAFRPGGAPALGEGGAGEPERGAGVREAAGDVPGAF